MKLLAALCLTVCVLAAAPASADIIQINYTGIITTVQSNTLGAPLGGINAPVSGSFTLDTSKGTLSIGGNVNTLQGGTGSWAYTGTDLISSASFSDGSMSFGTAASLGNDENLFEVGTNGSQFYWPIFRSSNNAYASAGTGATLEEMQILAESPLLTLTSSFNQEFTASGPSLGTVAFTENYFGCAGYSCVQSAVEYGNLTSITVRDLTTDSVPEPWTIDSFAAGLLGIGFLYCRRVARRAS